MALYTDVPKTHWASTYITLATYLGLVKGYPDGTFKPDNPITRAETVTIAVRQMGITLGAAGLMAATAYLLATKPGRR
jgi:expansin (peptidoglycan-binding protein)